MENLKVKDVMTPNPRMIRKNQTVYDAANRMKDLDCGILPVGDENHVVGVITDRDIVLRVVAENKDPSFVEVQDAMTKKVYSCHEEDDICKAANLMQEHNVARLLVINEKKISGIVTMTCLLRAGGSWMQGDKVLHTLLKIPNKGSRAHRTECALYDQFGEVI